MQRTALKILNLKTVAALAAAALAAAAAFASARITAVSGGRPAAEPPAEAASASAGNAAPAATSAIAPPRGSVQRVRFTLYKEGIFPVEARARKGRVIVAAEDRTGGDSSLVVERELPGASERVGQVRRAAAAPRGRAEFLLTPGRYVVFDAARPANRATLVVEP